MFKVNSRKTGKDLLARCVVEWWGVPIKQVVSGGFCVVSDGFCCLRVISDGFRWFAVLVVTRIAQHSQELFLHWAHERTWLTEIIQFLSCRLKISDCFLYSIVLFLILFFPILYSMSDKKLLLKEYLIKNSHKTQSKWSIANYLRRGVWQGASEFVSKICFALTGRLGELNQNGEISSLDEERRQACKVVRCEVFNTI